MAGGVSALRPARRHQRGLCCSLLRPPAGSSDHVRHRRWSQAMGQLRSAAAILPQHSALKPPALYAAFHVSHLTNNEAHKIGWSAVVWYPLWGPHSKVQQKTQGPLRTRRGRPCSFDCIAPPKDSDCNHGCKKRVVFHGAGQSTSFRF
eukprot:1157435-Pelagomonas_calceolata.AAC.10